MHNSGSHFGDRRLDPAERFFHDRLVEVGPRGVSVRGVGGHRAGEVRLGRFLRTEKVTVNKIVDKAAMTTSGRVDGLPILAIPDPTSFRDDGSGHGLVGHATIAVEAEPGTLLGAVDRPRIDRSGGGPKPPRNRPLRDKESHRWLETMSTSATVRNAAAHVTVVADREADIFAMFAYRLEGVDVQIRASRDCRLCDDTGPLFSRLEGRPQPEHTVTWPARPGPKERPARMDVRFACVTLKHPKDRPMEPGVPARQAVSIIEAQEIDPPAGVPRVHWRRLIRHRVATFEPARWTTQLDLWRWVIEPVFRTTKTKGFDIENVSVENRALSNTVRHDVYRGDIVHVPRAGPGWSRPEPP